MESGIRMVITKLEQVQKDIDNHNYKEVFHHAHAAYDQYCRTFGHRAIETVLIIDRILEMCKDIPELKLTVEYFEEERKYLEEGEFESDYMYDDYDEDEEY